MKIKRHTNYLFKHYKDEVHSFLDHLDKTKRTLDEKNIHQLRVDVKKMRAVFQLLQLLFPDKFNIEDYYSEIKPVYKAAGRVREMQVNLTCIDKYKLPSQVKNQYRKFIYIKEGSYKAKLIKAINDFDFKLINKPKKQIKKLIEDINTKKITDTCTTFISKEIKTIKQLLNAGNNPAIIHKIRMHLKSLSEVVSFFYNHNPDKELKKLLTSIKQIGGLIGNWHDKIVFIKSLEMFFLKASGINTVELFPIITLINKIKKDNEPFFEIIKHKLNPIFASPYSVK